MAHKVVGTGTTVAILAGPGATSIPISLQTGYLRIATSVASHVGIASTATATASRNDYFVPTSDVTILKDRVASSRVSVATTGTSTTYTFDQNNGNPFLVGDFVTVTGSSVSGYNCSHQLITSSNTTDLLTSALPVNAVVVPPFCSKLAILALIFGSLAIVS